MDFNLNNITYSVKYKCNPFFPQNLSEEVFVCVPSLWLSAKESACSLGGMGLIPGLGGSPAERNGYPLQYPCLENPMDRGPW